LLVDCHVHLVPPGLVWRSGDPAGRPRFREEGGAQLAEVAGRSARIGPADLTSLPGALEAARRRGLHAVVVSPWVQLGADQFDSPADATDAARVQNDQLARLVGPHVGALGTVPLRQVDEAVREVERALSLGLRGVQVGACVGGVFLGDDAFEPFWAAAERLGAVVFVHPTARGLQASALAAYFLWNSVGNPLETAISAAHLVAAGVLDRHPALLIVLAHGGGGIAALRGRLQQAWSSQPQARARSRLAPADALRGFLYDTVVYDAAVLRDLADFVGTDRLLLGSDHPFEMAELDPLRLVREAGLDPGRLGRTAAALFGLDG
jgi:aminocarboxymuconate-semialdehyde decarboxylase